MSKAGDTDDRGASGELQLDLQREHRFLLVSLDNLGDLVFASALVDPLRKRFPRAKISLWCREYTLDVARLMPHIASVRASEPFWVRAPGRKKGRIGAFVGGVRALRKEQHEIALVCSAQWRMALAVALTGVPVRIAQERHRNRRWLTHVLPPGSTLRPILEDLGQLLVPLGITPGKLAYRLDPSSLAPRAAELRAQLGGAPLVVLHPFASDPRRCVAFDRWRAVASGLAERGFTLLWIGSTRELDGLRANLGAVPRSHFVDRLGSGRLSDTAAALSLAKLFVGHDSGPLHIAGAFGVPSLGIFAPGHPERTFPQGVGPARMIARAGPEDVRALDMQDEIERLLDGRILAEFAQERSAPAS